MADPDARRLLAALAGRADADQPRDSVPSPGGYRDLIDEASEATESFGAAARFLECEDLDALAAAVERADGDLSARADEGREALEALRALEAAAVADRQFQSGLRSSKGSEDVAEGR